MRNPLSMKRIVVCAASLFLVGTLAGCGDEKASVNGTVKMDGEAVTDGAIIFSKSDGSKVREGAVIKDGSFQVRLPPGKYKIELNGKKVLGKETRKGMSGKDEEVEITGELFPEW